MEAMLSGTAFRKLFTSELLGSDEEFLSDHVEPEWVTAPGNCDWQDPSITGEMQVYRDGS